MGKSQRTKGASGERELCHTAADILGNLYEIKVSFQRMIGQARDGGRDVTMKPFSVEVKRRKTLKTFMEWMRQAEEGATAVKPGETPLIPLVVMREDNGPWTVMLSLEDWLSTLDPSVIATIEKEHPAPPPKDPAKVIDLMEALKASLNKENTK